MLLQLVVCITPPGLVMTLGHSSGRITEASAGMCEVIDKAGEKSRVVQVIHESVRDFFPGEDTCKDCRL